MSSEVLREMSDIVFKLHNADHYFCVSVCLELTKTVRTHWGTPYSYISVLLSLVNDWLKDPSIELESQIEDLYFYMDYEDALNGNTTFWYMMNIATIVGDITVKGRQISTKDFSNLIESICIVSSFEIDGRESHLSHMVDLLNSLQTTPTKIVLEDLRNVDEKFQVIWDLVCQNTPQTGVYALVNAKQYGDEIGLDFSEKIQRAILERRGSIDIFPYINTL